MKGSTSFLTNLSGLLALGVLVCVPHVALAQPLPAAVPVPAETGFLTRADFSLALALLGTDDPRFTAEGRLRADIDIADYGSGRANLLIDYDGILGNERHDFDLNHGNYVMEFSFSRRFGGTEVAGVFHHVSRHLNDREHQGSISWNLLGARASHQWTVGQATTIDGEISSGYAYEPHYVDYTWVHQLRVAVRKPLSNRASVFAGGEGELIRVDGEVRDHGPCGARLETGIHLQGRASAVELFLAYERRPDGFPTERRRVRFVSFGFRLFS